MSVMYTSAFWYLRREPEAMKEWGRYGMEGPFHIGEPTRAEILYSAENAAHRDEISGILGVGPIDLLVAATAVRYRLTVLPVDNDFVTLASPLTEARQRDIHTWARLPPGLDHSSSGRTSAKPGLRLSTRGIQIPLVENQRGMVLNPLRKRLHSR
jgi:predicted nucleic acid-binding protein